MIEIIRGFQSHTMSTKVIGTFVATMLVILISSVPPSALGLLVQVLTAGLFLTLAIYGWLNEIKLGIEQLGQYILNRGKQESHDDEGHAELPGRSGTDEGVDQERHDDFGSEAETEDPRDR